MTSAGIASVKQLSLPLAPPEDEARTGLRRLDAPVGLSNLLERALERSNMFRALRRVRRHQGAPGVDGMTVDGSDVASEAKDRGSASVEADRSLPEKWSEDRGDVGADRGGCAARRSALSSVGEPAPGRPSTTSLKFVPGFSAVRR